MRGVRGQQVVRLHGEIRKALTRSRKPAISMAARAHDPGPQRLLLRGVEEKACVYVAVWGAAGPCGAREAVPVEDAGSGPGLQAFRAASAMVGRSDGAGGAITGRHDGAAGAQPGVHVCGWNWG